MADAEITNKIFGELIKHREKVRAELPFAIQEHLDLYPRGCLIAYGELSARIGAPELTRSIGSFLFHVAKLCEEHGWPPLNALAVNKDSKMPGGGYDDAAQCDLVKWPDEVKDCMAFSGFSL
jgi:hypothetical protein